MQALFIHSGMKSERTKPSWSLDWLGAKRNMKGCYTYVSSKRKCGEIVGPPVNGGDNPLTDNRQKPKAFNAFFAYVFTGKAYSHTFTCPARFGKERNDQWEEQEMKVYLQKL